jgi:hypothetical protein
MEKSAIPQQQTLFRFINLRNPDLIDNTTRSTKFVSEPVAIRKGVFYTAIENKPPEMSKKEVLIEVSKTYIPLKEGEIEALNPGLYNFSQWLSRNSTTYTEAELVAEINGITPLTDGLNKSLHKVWENLFYQVITQNSFYEKEALMQMLRGDNLVRKYKAGDKDLNKKLANAKVELPSYLFDEYEKSNQEPTPIKNTLSLPDKNMKIQLELGKAEFSNTSCQILKDELQKIENEYRKEYQDKYSADYQRYLDEVTPILKQYEKDLEDARKEFCQISYNPDVPFNPNDPCQQPNLVPYPDLPKFEFRFREEIDPEYLEEKLTYNSYTTLLDVLGYKFKTGQSNALQLQLSPYEIIAENDTYEQLYEHINTLVGSNNQTIIDNTRTSVRNVSIGGVITPVTSGSNNLFIGGFSLCGKVSGVNLACSIFMRVPESWDVLRIKVTIKKGSTTQYETINAPNSSRTDNGIQLNNFYTYTYPDSSLENGPMLDFEFTFTNGCVKTISDINSDDLLSFCTKGILQGDGCNPNPAIKTPPLIPNGFGVKQIGIADYLKVEQEVLCYLEGEVSHIENIMAREYKEKATRRLVRTEETTTISRESEKEELTDTTTADRFEMQSEINKVIQQSKDRSGGVDVGFSAINTGLSFANNTSREDAVRQSVTKAQEITQQALERVVERIKEERIRKITEEFEENNKHGFDNRKGNQHVVGVYRWVNKLYKNQILNYGSRMMFEFAIPDPAKLHLLGMLPDEGPDNTVITDLTPPEDPRTASGTLNMSSYSSVNEVNSAYWAGVYNAEIKAKPAGILWSGKGIQNGSESSDLYVEIPEGYRLVAYKIKQIHRGGGDQGNAGYGIDGKGAYSNQIEAHWESGVIPLNKLYHGKVPVSAIFNKADNGFVHFDLKFELDKSLLDQWKLETFKAIMDVYYEALAEFNRKKEAEDNKAVEIKTTNPGFYRQIENMILRKNCISYLIDRNNYGQDFGIGDTFSGYEINNNEALDKYAAFSKFIEQAFEWEIMSYNFYPYYWAPKGSWKNKYQFNESDDPIFRAFMQAGMARVIVTVRPGFEKSVLHYMKTGEIWNGGSVPVIGDPLFMSIVEELKPIESVKYGKAWTSLVPTSLTILQAKSIGLEVEKALPCYCGENPDDFEPGSQLPDCENNPFVITDAELNGGGGTAKLSGIIRDKPKELNIKIVLKTIEGEIQDIAFTYDDVHWAMGALPAGKYELIIDPENVLEQNGYVFTEGFQQQTIELADGSDEHIAVAVRRA